METLPTPPARVLDKVRGLLAKAESTRFPAEAEALTAKAQELMARHCIEQAMLDGRSSPRRGAATMVEVTLDAPHAAAKLRILSAVARANRCAVVWMPGLRRASVFGFADDLDAVRTLFASLLVQATVALDDAGSKHDGSGRTRTVSFRRSFLIAFATRIGQRLRDVVDDAADAVAHTTGRDVVPLLDRRAAAAEAAARETFPSTQRMRTSVGNAEGWRAGTACAERADLGGRAGFGRLSA